MLCNHRSTQRSRKPLMIAAICAAALLLAVGAAGCHSPSDTKDTQKPTPSVSTPQEEPSSKPEPSSESKPAPSSEPVTEPSTEPAPVLTADKLVADDRSEHIVYDDTVGNHYDCWFSIPKLLIDSPDADAINAEIQANMLPHLESCLADQESGSSLIVAGAGYEAWMNGADLTVYAYIDTTWSISTHYFYTVDTTTGRRLSRSDLASRLGLTADELEERISQTMKSYFEAQYSAMASDNPMYADQLEKTLRQENVDAAQVYLDKSGTPMLCCSIYGFAGADSYEYLIPLEV